MTKDRLRLHAREASVAFGYFPGARAAILDCRDQP